MIYLATDHRGFQLKEKIKSWLKEWNYEFQDLGTFKFDPDDDYPDWVSKAAEAVSKDPKNSKAIILGASGEGEAMVANKYKNIRATVYYGRVGEIIILSREHNDANVLSLGASFLNDEEAAGVIKLWLETPFPADSRHVRRINKIKELTEQSINVAQQKEEKPQ